MLVLRENGNEIAFEIGEQPLTVGRSSRSDIHIDDEQASRHHCVIQKKGDIYILRDLDSTNGTYVGKERAYKHILKNGDEIAIGEARIVFVAGYPFKLLVFESSEKRYDVELDRPVISIGRSSKNQIVLTNESVSRHHAELRRLSDGGYEIIDLDSANGTLVAGQPITRHELRDGDDIEIGYVALVFQRTSVNTPPIDTRLPTAEHGKKHIVGLVHDTLQQRRFKIAAYALLGIAIAVGIFYLSAVGIIPIRRGVLSASSGELEATLNEHGFLSVGHESWHSLWGGQVVLIGHEGQLLTRQALSVGSEVTRLPDESLQLDTVLPGIKDGKQYNIKLTLKGGEKGIQVFLPQTKNLGDEIGAVGFMWSCSPQNLSTGMHLASRTNFVEHTRPFKSTDPALALSWGNRPDILHMFFAQETALSCSQTDDGNLLCLSSPTGSEGSLQNQTITMRLFSEERTLEIANNLEEAAREKENGNWGRALAIYRSMAKQYYYLEAPISAAAQEIPAIIASATEQLNAAYEAYQRAQVTKDDTDFQAVENTVMMLSKSLAGTELAAKSTALLVEVSSQRMKARHQKLQAEAKMLLDRAEAHLARGKIDVASSFFEQVIHTFPNTIWSRTAQQRLSVIAEMGSVPEADIE